jgi:alanyl aminopeptidase
MMTDASVDWTLKRASACPAWLDANDAAKGYYRMDYRGDLLSALTRGDVVNRLRAAERVELMDNAQAMSDAGRLAAAEALEIAEVFHADPEREVLQRALRLATSIREAVADDLLPKYRRFLSKNFQSRARELGWVPRAGEAEDVRLLRPVLVSALATIAEDHDLANEAQALADRWFQNRGAVHPDVTAAVLRTAAYYGDTALFNRMLAEFKTTNDRQEQQQLLNAMTSFRDPAALEIGMRAVAAKEISLDDGFPMLLAGREFPATRKVAFQFVKAHFDEIMAGHPSMFGFDLGALLPHVGDGFCDAESRAELDAFFQPLTTKYVGAARELAKVLEGIDLCIARTAAQRPSVAAFLAKF